MLISGPGRGHVSHQRARAVLRHGQPRNIAADGGSQRLVIRLELSRESLVCFLGKPGRIKIRGQNTGSE